MRGVAGMLLPTALACIQTYACSPQVSRVAHSPGATPAASASLASTGAGTTRVEPHWPPRLEPAMANHGPPHAQPLALPPDSRGGEQWLAIVGTNDVAWGAWHVARTTDGTLEAEPIARWPSGVRVVGGTVDGSTAYLLLETLGVLDQPAGLRGTLIDELDGRSPFEGSPMALAGVADANELAERLRHPPPPGAAERNSSVLLSTLRAAGASPDALLRSLSSDGADIEVAWQSLFLQRVDHIDPERPGGPSVERALDILRRTLETQACGADACESWGDRARTVVRLKREGSRWTIRSLIEDAVPRPVAAGATPSHVVATSSEAKGSEEILRARFRRIERTLGEAPLTAGGGSIGVAITDAFPNVPVVVLREGASSRLFEIGVAATQLPREGSIVWDAAFADVDGDGRTDVALRMSQGADASRPPWTQVYLAPPPSVQVSSLEADLPSALATLGAQDASSASKAAVSVPTGGVELEDACRLLASASTPSGFRRVSSADAVLLLFKEPGMPTWKPRALTPDNVTADAVRGLGSHCAELTCDGKRPYCATHGTIDSEHAWFDWHNTTLELRGVADYDGD